MEEDQKENQVKGGRTVSRRTSEGLVSIVVTNGRGQKGIEACCERILGPTWAVALRMGGWN